MREAGPPSVWTDEAIAFLREKASAGWSATQISCGLSEGGMCFSRSAVIGKLHRCGIALTKRLPKPSAVTPAKPRGWPYAKSFSDRIVEKLAAAETATPASPALQASVPVRLVELEDDRCHWPLHEDADGHQLFCGATATGRYCEAHATQSRLSHERKSRHG